MVMPAIGRCFGSCTIPRTVPNTVANAFPVSSSKMTPIKINLRTPTPLLAIYERAVFDAMWFCIAQGREEKQRIATRFSTVEAEETLLRENAENYLCLSQARQSS